MKRPKLALEYFIRLIELGELVSRRNSFHRMYSGELKIESFKLIVHKYDADNEVAVYETKGLGYPSGKFVTDFGQDICHEVGYKTLNIKAGVLRQLSACAGTQRNLFCCQMTTDIERLSSLVANDHVFAKYPCIAAALLDIREFVLTYAPQQTEKDLVSTPSSIEGQVVSYQYKYINEGSRMEDKALTRSFLRDLFHKLRDELELIAPDTSVEDFRAIFSGKVVVKPVVWTGTNTQLRHFFKSIETKLMPLTNRKVGKWVTVAACFVRSNGESFTAGQLQSTGATGSNVPRIREIEELRVILR